MIRQRPVDTGDWVVSLGEAGGGLDVLGEGAVPPLTHTADGRLRVVFDGVLYDDDDMLADGIMPGTNPAERIWRLYESLGERMFRQIKGLFALIVVDQARQTVLCARDPLGIYPLFYAEAGRELLLSRSIDALLRDSRVSGCVNQAALAEYLCHRWSDVQETFFTNIHRVPPGHVMRVDRTGHQVCRYWDPAPAARELEWVAEADLNRFDQLLDRAVGRLLDFGPAAIFLSGGLDSVTVAAVAADVRRRRDEPLPLALSLVFPDPDCNEEDTQKQVAAALELPQRMLSFAEAVGPSGLLLAALEASRRSSSPLQNVWNPAYERLAAEGTRSGCEVILTGGGGDEWLTVTPVYAADLLRAADLGGLWRLAASIRRSYRLPALSVLRNVMWTNGARLLLREAWWWSLRRAADVSALRSTSVSIARRRRRRSQRMPSWLLPDGDLRRELDRRIEFRIERAISEHEQPSFYFRELRQVLDHPLTTLELEEIFESGRRLGLRILQPFWDAELVEFLCRVPPRLLNRGRRSKGLVRESMRKRFPGLDFGHQKKVVSIDFFRSTMLKEGAGAWSAMRGAPALAEIGVVDPHRLNATMEDILANRRLDQAGYIWEVLNLEAWLRPRL